MLETEVSHLLDTGTVTVRDIRCSRSCRHRSEEECAETTHLVFPYRGVFLRHVGGDQAVGDANQVLFFNAGEGYRVSHPVQGGDDCLDIAASEEILRELAPAALLNERGSLGFRRQQQPMDPGAQALVAILRHSLQSGSIERLEAESLSLSLLCRTLGPRSSREFAATYGKRRLVDRVKILLAGDLSRRWTLADIADEMRGSPVYLTQVFRQVEGVPLYRYHLRLRLARALDLIPRYEDLSALANDLGFSSHSHFTAAFKQTYRRSPTAFKASTLRL